MMGIQKAESQRFYEFDLGAHVPSNHALREIDRLLDIDWEVRSNSRPSLAKQVDVRLIQNRMPDVCYRICQRAFLGRSNWSVSHVP